MDGISLTGVQQAPSQSVLGLYHQTTQQASTEPQNYQAEPSDARQAQLPRPPVSLDEALVRSNAVLQAIGSALSFTKDEDSGRRLVKVVDTETGELIRQIPSKEILAVAQAIEEGQGLLEGVQA